MCYNFKWAGTGSVLCLRVRACNADGQTYTEMMSICWNSCKTQNSYENYLCGICNAIHCTMHIWEFIDSNAHTRARAHTNTECVDLAVHHSTFSWNNHFSWSNYPRFVSLLLFMCRSTILFYFAFRFVLMQINWNKKSHFSRAFLCLLSVVGRAIVRCLRLKLLLHNQTTSCIYSLEHVYKCSLDGLCSVYGLVKRFWHICSSCYCLYAPKITCFFAYTHTRMKNPWTWYRFALF